MPSLLTINTVSFDDIFSSAPSVNSVLFSRDINLALRDPRLGNLFSPGSIPASKLGPVFGTSLAQYTLSGYTSPSQPGQLAIKTITSLNLADNAAKGPQGGVPAGTIIFYAGVNAPAGYLFADGSFVEVADYQELFAAIGYAYGSDGIGRFRLPDLRDLFVRGSTDTTTVGVVQQDQIKEHTHTVSISLTSTPELAQFGGSKSIFNAAPGQFPVLRDVTFNIAPNLTVGQASAEIVGGNETRPKNISMMACIKY